MYMKNVSRGKVLNLIGGLLLVAGLAVLLVGWQTRRANMQVQAQPALVRQSPAVVDPAAVTGQPAVLNVPSVGIGSPVIDGAYNATSGQWTLTLDKVQFATITSRPNDRRGLTFMYGHNRREVFARLPAIQKGALAEVKTDNGHIFRYRFVGSQVVKPSDVSIFAYDGAPILVLQTCTGLFYQNRQLFTFEFVGVDTK
jgi:LPXTG-site transpeptidase (sortase) family protein